MTKQLYDLLLSRHDEPHISFDELYRKLNEMLPCPDYGWACDDDKIICGLLHCFYLWQDDAYTVDTIDGFIMGVLATAEEPQTDNLTYHAEESIKIG